MIPLAMAILLGMSTAAYSQSMTDMDFVWRSAFGSPHGAKPPVRYLHKFDGTLHGPNYLQPAALRFHCAQHILGCATKFRPRHCTIYIDATLSAEKKREVYQHELAHCNGWPSHHPR